MNIRVLIAILASAFCVGKAALSQAVVTPSSNSCTCDGQMSFQMSLSSSTVFTIRDYQGNIVATVNSPDGSLTQTNLCAQPYSIQAVQGGQTSLFVFNVPAGSVNPGASLTLDLCSTSGSLNLNNQLTGFISGGSWYSPVGQPISNILNASSATSGWYNYHYNSSGCDIITGVYVNFIQNANPGLSTTYLICENYSPFELLTVMQGTPDSGGQWYFASNNQAMNGWFYPETMDSQQFYYTINNVVGCGPVTSFLTIIENQIPSPGVSTAISVCENAAPVNMTNYLGGTPQTNGQWYNPVNAQVSNMFNPAVQSGGVYTYQVNGLTPCNSQQSQLTITVIPDNPSGENSSVTLCSSHAPVNMMNFLSGNPVPGGVWKNSANQQVDAFFNPATQAAGNYSYTYPAIGCSVPQSLLSVSVEQTLNAGADSEVMICSSTSSFNLNSLLGNGVTIGGIWTNSASQQVGPTISIDPSITTQQYTYTVSGTACPGDASVHTLNIVAQLPPLPDLSIGLCATGGVVNLNDYYPEFPFAYFTTAGGTAVSNIFDPAVQGSISFQTLNPAVGGCAGSQASLNITVEQPTLLSGTTSLELCQSLGSYNLNLADNSINFQSGHWENSSGQSISSVIDLDFVGQKVYHFISDPQAYCASATFTVTVNSYEQYSAGEDVSVTLCDSAPVQDINALAGSLGDANGSWYLNNAPYSSTSFNPSQEHDVILEYRAPANGPCPTHSCYLTIHVQHGIDYSAGANITQCFGSEPMNLGSPAQAGTSYHWSPSTNLSSTAAASPLVSFYSSNTQPVTIEYTVSVNDGICAIESHVSVTTLPKPVSNLPNEYQICKGESVNLVVLGNDLVCDWFPQSLFSGNSQFQLVEPSETTDIEVIISNEWNCLAYDTTKIVVHPLPNIAFLPEATPGCPPLQVHYEYYPQSSENISWSIPGVGNYYGNQLNTTLSNTGNYDLILNVVSSFGCSKSVQYSHLMEVYPTPVSDFEISRKEITTVDPEAKFINTSQGAESYLWDFGGWGSSTEVSPQFEFPNDDPTTFTICLEASNEFGCKDTSCSFLPLKNIYIFYAPNAFTPDNDGINDGFKPVILGFVESTYSFYIFDRWGEKIFETHDVNEAWMGNAFNGDYYVPEGVYTWRVEVKEKIIANFEVFQGYVTLIR